MTFVPRNNPRKSVCRLLSAWAAGLRAILLPVFFMALLLVLPSTQARAVDGVVISNNLRVLELTRHIHRIAPDMLEFAVQNTSKTAVSYELIASEPDPFHYVFLGQHYRPPTLRLIGSDDTETTSPPNQPHLLVINLAPGAVTRFILQGDIRPQTGFWLWNPTYRAQIQARTTQFQHMVYASLAILLFLSIPVALKRRRKRLLFLSVITFSFLVLFYLRWSVPSAQLWQGAGVNNLRISLLVVALLVGLAHRAIRHVPWIERRYWRSVVICVDIALVLAIMGWIVQYFSPFFIGIATRQILEITLALAPALLCLAGIVSLRLPTSNRPPTSSPAPK